MISRTKPLPTSRANLDIDARAHSEAFQEAFNAHDVKALVNLFAEDAHVIWPGEGQEARGKAEIEKLISSMFERFPDAKATFQSHEVLPLGTDYVAAVGHWEESFMTPDGKPATVVVRTTEILRKEGNKTVYAIDHASLGIPPME